MLLTSEPLRDDCLRRAGRRDRVLRAAVIAALAPVAVWIITRWLSRVSPVDFLIYRYASALALHGTNVYAHNLSGPMIAPGGGMPYTYTPFALIALLPTVLGGWHIAYLTWCLAAMLAIAWAENAVVIRVVPLGAGTRRAAVLACALTMTAASTMMINEISFGQVNSLLLLACLADLFRPRSGRLARLVPPGTLVGIATAIKLTPGLLICYFAVTGQWRLARDSALSCIACLLAGTMAYPGMTAQFYSSVIWHLPGRVALGGFATYGNNSVQGILAAIGPGTAPWRTPASIAVAALGLRAARACHNRGRELDAWLITGITSQLAAPVSWIHHWVWLAPAVLLAAARARTLVARAGAGVTTAMLLIGPGTGNNLLHHGPEWALPFAALQRECLVTAGLWCIAMFLAQRPRCPMPVDMRFGGPVLRLETRMRRSAASASARSDGLTKK